MVKTSKIYYENAYTDEFDAMVLSCREGKDGNFFVVLDRTAFFPEQGGQSSDTGVICLEDGTEINVSHTSIKEGIITHVTDREIPEGTKVHGKIDFDHRFSNMQQHTGEHIFSGIVNSRFGYDNVGFHLSDSEVTMDYNGILTPDDIKEIELAVNEAIWRNIEVICAFPSDEELEKIDYRSKKELSGDIRIVTIPGVDVCACCAPHVKRTGEIGLLKVVSLQAYKGGVRVSILCGRRALLFLQKEHEILNDVSRLLTTGTDKVFSSVERLSEENHEVKAKLSKAGEELLRYELSEIDKSLENVLIVKEDLDGNLMRKTVTALMEDHGGFCGVFCGNDKEGYRYVLATGALQKDVMALQNVLKNEFGAKGGGKPPMIQGSLPAVSIDEVLRRCKEV